MDQIAGGFLKCKACGYMMSCEQPGAGAEVVSVDVVRERNYRFYMGFYGIIVSACYVLQ